MGSRSLSSRRKETSVQEARHASCWAALNQDMDFTTGAFDAGIAKAKVVAAVTPFFAM